MKSRIVFLFAALTFAVFSLSAETKPTDVLLKHETVSKPKHGKGKKNKNGTQKLKPGKGAGKGFNEKNRDRI